MKKRRVNLSSLFWENSNEKGNQMEKKKKGRYFMFDFFRHLLFHFSII